MYAQEFIGAIICVHMIIVYPFQLIYQIFIVYVGFAIVINKFKVSVNDFPPGMEYDVLGLSHIDSHFVGPEPSCYFFKFHY